MFAVLTISDRASAEPSVDVSGALLRTELEAATSLGLRCHGTRIVPDDIPCIREAVRAFVSERSVCLVITTGGTGFGVRDCTPEAVGPLLERQAPGIVHLLVASSLQKTPLAALSRPVAGTIGNAFVITLPGSAKAVKECVGTLLSGDVLRHALELIRGGSGERVHKALAADSPSDTAALAQYQGNNSHRHRHHHHHHDNSHGHARPRLARDPTASVALRQRESPFPIVPLDEALEMVLSTVPVLSAVCAQVGPNLRGHVIAEDVHAPQDAPASMTTNVDGYALRSTDPPGVYNVLSPQSWPDRSKAIPTAHIYRINTGAPLPAGCDAVIMVEDTELVSSVQDAAGRHAEEKQVKTIAQVSAGENVRMPGTDARKGDLVMQRGQVVSGLGGEVGTLAFVGKQEVSVYRKPVVALLSTGNELCDLQDRDGGLVDNESWGGIWDTNRPSLHTALESLGYEVLDYGIVPDDFQGHRSKLQAALAKADLLLTTGGSSMGSSDLLKPVIEDLGGVIHFGRVRIKPGKPTTFATLPTDGADKVIFALPGNPASALVCFNVFVIPALRRLGGFGTKNCKLPRIRVEIEHSMRVDSRPEFHRVIIHRTTDGRLKAHSTGGQRSSRVASLSGANGLVALPARKDGEVEEVAAGAEVDAILVGEIVMD